MARPRRIDEGLVASTALLLHGERQEDFDALHAEIGQSFARAPDEENLLASQLTEAAESKPKPSTS